MEIFKLQTNLGLLNVSHKGDKILKKSILVKNVKYFPEL